MIEENTWKWILINKSTKEYYSKHNSETIPRNGDPDKIEWIEWNKPLPEDIDTVGYKYENGELVKET